MRVAAVVVNFNAGLALSECLRSLDREGLDEIVVVDNGSTDDSLVRAQDAMPRATFVESDVNVGYGGGANLGVQHTTCELILVCNPDVVIEAGAIKLMVAVIEYSPDIGLVGPQLLNEDGLPRRSGGRFPALGHSSAQALLGVVFPDSRWSKAYRRKNRDSTAGPVDWVTGACFLVRRVAFEAVGGFDPGFFMYVEEIDLCWRLARAGWSTIYEPAARVVHLGGVSTSPHPYRMAMAHHRSLWRYARRTTADWRLLPVVAAGLAARWAIVIARLGARSAISTARHSGHLLTPDAGSPGRTPRPRKRA